MGSTGAGTLEAGAPADMAWWERDPVGADPASLIGMAALATWRNGVEVHRSPLA